MTGPPGFPGRDGGPEADVTELFRSPNLLVRRVARGRADVAVVTFACLLDPPDIAAPGFGEAFLRDRGIDAVHVTCGGNDWYQYPEWPLALACIRQAVRRYGRVLAYGSSMGGYAAVRYGGAAGAQVALAISPQFSIDGRRVPFERRWHAAAARIRFLHEGEAPAVAQATIVYDPRNPDRRHVDLIAAAVPVSPIRLPHAGHPSGAYLAETGLLPVLLLACCRGDLDPGFAVRARQARRRSGQYHMTLARKLGRRRLPAKLALARCAAALVPDDPVYRSYLAVVLDHARDPAAAAAHRRAVDLGPDIPSVLARAARFLLRVGQVAEAVALAGRLRAMQPRDAAACHLLAVALLAAGRPGAALRLAGRCRSWAVLPDAARLLVRRPTGDGWRARLTGGVAPRLPLHLGVADDLRAADIVVRPEPGRGEG